MTAWFDYPITHGYIPNYDPSTWDTPHYAVDLAMPVDTPITAIKPGKVVQEDYATWGGQPGGGEVFIKPDDGSVEYYFYHLDQIDVFSGEHVGAGQEVGLSGGQNSGGSHPTSPAWSSGPHLHVGYFTGFSNTPVGNRPVGPDITPTIKQMAAGGMTYVPTVSQSSSAGSSDAGTIERNIGFFIIAIVGLVAGAMLLLRTQGKWEVS